MNNCRVYKVLFQDDKYLYIYIPQICILYLLDIAECESNDVDTIYSLVLSNDHIVIINNIPVITLGHEIEDPVDSHEYLGTQQIISDLERINVDGIVVNPKLIRDLDTNMIIGLQK